MKKQLYSQTYHHYRNQINTAAKAIKQAKDEYIKANAPNPIGTVANVDNNGRIRPLKIVGYYVESDFRLIPFFESIEGKPVIANRPIILDIIK